VAVCAFCRSVRSFVYIEDFYTAAWRLKQMAVKPYGESRRVGWRLWGEWQMHESYSEKALAGIGLNQSRSEISCSQNLKKSITVSSATTCESKSIVRA
jgi:hypothetical protein